MCQPGLPGPQGESQAASSCSFCDFQRAKSRWSRSARFRLLGDHVLEPCAGEPPVLREPRDAEVHVAVRDVRLLAREELLDELDDLGDRLRRPRLHVRTPETEVVRVLEEPAVACSESTRLGIPCRSASAYTLSSMRR